MCDTLLNNFSINKFEIQKNDTEAPYRHINDLLLSDQASFPQTQPYSLFHNDQQQQQCFPGSVT